jgi:hypothetical protein
VCRRDRGRDPRASVADDGNRAPDIAERAQREREEKHRRNASVMSEPERETVVPPRVEHHERAFQMIARFAGRQAPRRRRSGGGPIRRIGCKGVFCKNCDDENSTKVCERRAGLG